MSNRLTLSNFWHILKITAAKSNQDKLPRLGAALAYYTVFSIVPMLIIIISVVGLAFGQDAAQGYIFDQLSSGLFGELQDTINTIWGVEAKDRSILKIIQDRFFSFVTVIGTGFLLMVSLLINASLAAFGKWFVGWFLGPEILLHIIDYCISFVTITILFASMYKFVPDVHIPWSNVWIGAVLTSFLFMIGKFAIGMYLGKSDIGNSFGAAGSLVILLVWVYYSAQIFLFGAEFTQVYGKYFRESNADSNTYLNVDKENIYRSQKLTSNVTEVAAKPKNRENLRDFGIIALLAFILLKSNARK